MLRSFNYVLTMLAESWSLKSMTNRVTSFPANLPEACNGCLSATLELIKVLMADNDNEGSPDLRIKTSNALTPPKNKATRTRDRA